MDNSLRKAAEDLMPILERWKMTYPPCTSADWDKVEALRQALAQPEEKMRVEGSGKLTTKPYPDRYEFEQQFRKALAQPEQEPVFGMFEEKMPDQNPPPWVRDYKAKEKT